MARYALVRQPSNLVVNIVEWDGDLTKWSPPSGYAAKADPIGTASVGGTWTSGTTFSPAPPAPPPDPQIALDVQAVKDYLAATTPTVAQTVAAIKALGRGRNANG